VQGATTVVMMEAQSEHLASIDWQRGKWADAKGKYSREHHTLHLRSAELLVCKIPIAGVG
jgi:hypothetical protein